MTIPVMWLNRCRWDAATEHGQFWTKKYINDLLEEKGYPFIDGYKEDASRNCMIQSIEDGAGWLTGVGHGNATKWTGQKQEVLLDAGHEDDRNRINNNGVMLTPISCSFGKSFRSWSTFRGYTDLYIFIRSSSAPDDKVALQFADCSFTLERELIKAGRITKDVWEEACKRTTEKWNFYIQSGASITRPYFRRNRDLEIFQWMGAPEVEPSGWCKFWKGVCDFILTVAGCKSE